MTDDRTNPAKRPWVAAVLAVLIIGLGHAYLRHWGRAFVWLLLVLMSAYWFVPDAGITEAGVTALLPIAAVAGMSVLDAYLLAREQARAVQAGSVRSCPECGRKLDESIDFCWYCSADRSRKE